MNIDQLKTVYFLGIGGIGMSALARYLHGKGVAVSGYDKTQTELTIQLEHEGIAIHYSANGSLIPEHTELVVYTPAVPESFEEWNEIHARNLPVMKRAAFLAEVVNSLPSIAVAGTHGKTTTTAMIAHTLSVRNKPFLGFVGGVLCNYNTNVFVHPLAEIAVAEADEYDRSFLALHPYVAVINATDADHLDIYGGINSLFESFSLFAEGIAPGGKILIFEGAGISNLRLPEGYIIYGFHNQIGYRAENIRIENSRYLFDVTLNNCILCKNIELPSAGRHNVQNALAALAALHLTGVDPSLTSKALSHFPGVKRRLEKIADNGKIIYYDDYAHHPAEISALIQTIRELHPSQPITGIFQPHLFSRTRDFANEFADILSTLDIPVVTDIYPARELPIEGITSNWLLSKINNPAKRYIPYHDIPKIISTMKNGILLTIGAGDIDMHIQTLKTHIEES